ncbi:MAG: hypothetical protein AAGA34_12540 [Pseudomonadota bacterium]
MTNAKDIRIAGRSIRPRDQAYVISEMSGNHNGCLEPEESTALFADC